MSNYKTIAKNSILLYVRMAIVMVINLYTVRVVLNALGVEDYGIYNAVAGIITLLECVTSVLSSATQRFYSSCTGEDVTNQLSKVFSTSLSIFLIFSIVVVVVGETAGLWFVSQKLVIPLERKTAALWIYHFSIVSFVARLVQTPYYSATIAHEDMNYFAIINVTEYVLKLILAFIIPLVRIDHLVYYGLYLMIISILVLAAYIFIAKKKYKECRFIHHKDKTIYKDILSFSGWTFFGSVAGVGMNQVNTILTNIFFGPIVNASRAIALQITSAVNLFSSNIVLATRPQVTKSIAENDDKSALEIFSFSNKFIFYLILIILIPLFYEMDTVLFWWLGKNDEQMVLFSRIVLLYTLIMAIGNPITILIQAIGRVKEYFVFVEVFTLLCPVVTFICFKIGYAAHWAFIIMLVAACCSHVIRLICLKRFFHVFSVREYTRSFLLPAIGIAVFIMISLYPVHQAISSELLRFLLVTLLSIVLVIGGFFTIGLTRSERLFVINYFRRFTSHE